MNRIANVKKQRDAVDKARKVCDASRAEAMTVIREQLQRCQPESRRKFLEEALEIVEDNIRYGDGEKTDLDRAMDAMNEAFGVTAQERKDQRDAELSNLNAVLEEARRDYLRILAEIETEEAKRKIQ
jgi:recombinational DNA repair ATPase RecF